MLNPEKSVGAGGWVLLRRAGFVQDVVAAGWRFVAADGGSVMCWLAGIVVCSPLEAVE
jgi:hypothetical protein